jgi:cell division protein FtsB
MPGMPDTPRPRQKAARSDTREPLRRRAAASSPPLSASPIWRRGLNFLLVFATVVLLADALVGERGLVATSRAQRVAGELSEKVERMRRENRRLRSEAQRLREDPTAIESLAREELGLIRPGEVLVVVKDRKPAGK